MIVHQKHNEPDPNYQKTHMHQQHARPSPFAQLNHTTNPDNPQHTIKRNNNKKSTHLQFGILMLTQTSIH